MKLWITKRIAIQLFLLWAVPTLVFFLMHWLPGDPVLSYLGEGAAKGDVRRVRRELGLDRSLFRQYLGFQQGLLHGDLGRSLSERKAVTETILSHLPNTFLLAAPALLLAIMISLLLAATCLVPTRRLARFLVELGTAAGMAVPGFLWGILLIWIFALRLHWLPISGGSGWRGLALPVLTLALAITPLFTRIINVALEREWRASYVLLARAKGLSLGRIFWGHILRHLLIPLVTMLGLVSANLLSGTVITEIIFSRPGIGYLLLTAIQKRDYPLVQGVVLFIAIVYLLASFLVDLSYPLIDPRVRYA